MNNRKSIASLAEVIETWGSCAALGAETGERAGTVRQWRNRNRIPPDHRLSIAQAARKRGDRRITVALMARLAVTATRSSA